MTWKFDELSALADEIGSRTITIRGKALRVRLLSAAEEDALRVAVSPPPGQTRDADADMRLLYGRLALAVALDPGTETFAQAMATPGPVALRERALRAWVRAAVDQLGRLSEPELAAIQTVYAELAAEVAGSVMGKSSLSSTPSASPTAGPTPTEPASEGAS